MKSLRLFFLSENILPDGLRDVVGGGGEGQQTKTSIAELPALRVVFASSYVDCQWEEADALAAINFCDLWSGPEATYQGSALTFLLAVPMWINAAEDDTIYQGSALASLFTVPM